MPSASAWEEIAVEEYLKHPEYRTICSFFLGWLTMAALYHVLCSVYFRDMCIRVYHISQSIVNRTQHRLTEDPEAPAVPEKAWVKGDETASIRHRFDRCALVFTLNLCLLSAGVTYFSGLLSFHSRAQWDVGCAFVVAWGGMTAQAASLLCSSILCLELKRDHHQRWEQTFLWAVMLIGLALVFVTNGLSAGTTGFVEPLNIYVCQRGSNYPVSLAAALVQLGINLYLIVRLVMVRLPPSFRIRSMVTALEGPTIRRAWSVLVLNIATLIPNAMKVNMLAQFLPFSIGALVVLAVFNYHPKVIESSFVLPVPPGFAPPAPPSPEPPVDAQVQVAPTENGYSFRISVLSDRSFDSDILGSVEDAIISTAVRHMTASSDPMLLPLVSAPPRIEAFSSHPPGARHGHILPSQVEFAEQLEKELASRNPGHRGPVVRPADFNRRLRVLITDDDSRISNPADARTPGSIIGSDIIYRSPVQTRNRATFGADKQPPDRSETFGVLAVEVPEEESYIATQDILSEYYPDRRSFSIISHRTTGAGSMRSTKHSTRHFSVTSHRRSPMDELPSVPERGNGENPSITSSVRRSRRTTFGRPVSSSSRRTNATRATHELVPPVPQRPSIFLNTNVLPRQNFDALSPVPVEPLRIHKSAPRLPIPMFSPMIITPSVTSPAPSTIDTIATIGTNGVRRPRPLPHAPIPDNVGGPDLNEDIPDEPNQDKE